jgi:uncharacterized membrane protein
VPIERIRVTKRLDQKKTLADRFVDVIGSWKFILGQTFTMILWVILNVRTPMKPDPYPFILLNLMLSTQAALLGPIILMSNNRQGALDRERDESHYMIDIHESEVVEGMATELERIAKRLEENGEEHWAG